LAEAGYAVAVPCNASREAADEVVAEIRSRGGRAGIARADLGNSEEVERLVPAAAAAVGPVTLLVNNAVAMAARLPMSRPPSSTSRGLAPSPGR
jgi:NAD(P)-dependent dehydrogenase (short-subunit alcohol dehydrogenase family)